MNVSEIMNGFSPSLRQAKLIEIDFSCWDEIGLVVATSVSFFPDWEGIFAVSWKVEEDARAQLKMHMSLAPS